MPLYRTDKVEGHKHFVYQGPNGSVASTDRKHQHQVMDDGSLGIAEEHTHNVLVDEPLNKPYTLPKESDEDVVREVWRLFKVARGRDKDSIAQATESEDFYAGKQWAPGEKEQLQAESRAALTINHIEPKIDILEGIQRQSRTMIHYLPIEDGDQRMADIYNLASTQILHNCDFDENETEVFVDSCIGGRGVFNVYVDYNRNIEGDIIVERYNWKDVIFGPHAKKDLSDLEYYIKTREFSEANAKSTWPNKADKITAVSDEMANLEDRKSSGIPMDDVSDAVVISVAGVPIMDIANKKFVIVECWRKVFYQSNVIYNEPDDASFRAVQWKDSEINSVLTIPGFISIPRMETRFRVTRVAGNVLLSDGMPRIFQKEFPIAVMYAKKRDNGWWGKVDSIKDCQRETNKRRSQVVDIVNKSENYGWFFDGNTFPTPKIKTQFINESARPGFTIEVANVEKPPMKVEGTRFPSEIAQLELASSESIRELMNIPRELQGIASGSQESGIAILRKQRQGLIGNEYLFDNLSITKRRLARILLHLIREIYTPERLWRLVQNAAKQTGDPKLQQFDEGTKKAITDLIANDDPERYDIAITESPDSPSVRQTTFTTLAELAARGYPVPPNALIRFADVPEEVKVELIGMFQQQQQAESQQAQEKNQTEIVKTQIAAQSKNQEKYGGGLTKPQQ